MAPSGPDRIHSLGVRQKTERSYGPAKKDAAFVQPDTSRECVCPTKPLSKVSGKVGNAIGLMACLFFFAAGQAFVPMLGIENDEALFANPLFYHGPALYSVPGSGIPLMVITYIGALKTWIYAPVFRIFGTGVWQLREPAVLAGAVSVWLFFLLLRRVAGMRAAVIGACLLAADSDYLLTVCYDWGPVALQHLLVVGGLLLALRFCQTGQELALGGAFSYSA